MNTGLADVTLGEPACRSWVMLFGVLPVDYDDITLERVVPPRSFLEDRSPKGASPRTTFDIVPIWRMIGSGRSSANMEGQGWMRHTATMRRPSGRGSSASFTAPRSQGMMRAGRDERPSVSCSHGMLLLVPT